MSNLEKGKKLFEQREYQKAIDFLSEFLTENKNHADALYTRALCYRKIGLFDNSIKDFSSILKRLPNEPSLLSERGVSFFHKKDFKNSLKDMDKAVELDPNNPYRYSSRAYIRANIDTKGAINDYKKAIELDPKDEISYNNLGLLQENIGQTNNAQKSFTKSNEIIGYNPEKRKTNEKKLNEVIDSNSSMGEIIIKVFTSSEVRNEYFKFLKSFLFKK